MLPDLYQVFWAAMARGGAAALRQRLDLDNDGGGHAVRNAWTLRSMINS